MTKAHFKSTFGGANKDDLEDIEIWADAFRLWFWRKRPYRWLHLSQGGGKGLNPVGAAD